MTSCTEGRLQNKVVVVTGAGRGIGRAYAEFAAAEGASVVVNDVGADMNGDGVSEGFANEVADGIRSRGGTAVADNHDIAAAAPLVIQRAVDEFGRIDGLVNNAGIVIMAGIEEFTPDQIQRMIGIHVVGTISATQAAWPIMRRQGYGRIVNTSSASVFGVGGAPLYPTAKSAIIGLTKALAIDGAAHGIKVNAVMPMGYSRMADIQAGLGDFMMANFSPTQIAPFVGALLVDQTPCTGEIFAVAGGRAARVFLGTVPGLTGFQTIEDVLANFDQVMEHAGFVAPNTMDEEIGYEYQHLGIDLSQLGINLDFMGNAVGGISCLLRRLGLNPDQRRKLHEDRTLIPRAIEESLRIDSPVLNLVRTVTEDTVFGGTAMKASDKVMVPDAAGNRDEDVFPDAATFDIERANAKKHLAFSSSFHLCQGAGMARLEMRVVLEEMLNAIPDYDVQHEGVEFGSVQGVHSVKKLPVTFTPPVTA